MVISNYRLPQIDLPTEKILNDDDDQVLAAFKVILDGYKRAQQRNRSITKAYTELESITLSILKDYEEEKKISRENEPGKSPGDRNNVKVESSTPNIKKCQSTDVVRNIEGESVEIINLISQFNVDRKEEPRGNTRRETSPIFGEMCERNMKKRKLMQKETPRDDGKKNVERHVDPSTSETSKISNKEGNVVERHREDEENKPPLENKSSFKNDSLSHPNESRLPAKIGLAKSVYKIDAHRTPKRKSSKQSTLIFQPITAKTDLTVSDNNTASKCNVPQDYINLFDEDYRTKKKSIDPPDHQRKISNTEAFANSNQQTSSADVFGNPEISNPRKNEKDKQREEISSTSKEIRLLSPTSSQINDTARMIFDDEDLDNFPTSPDILNTCMESNIFDDSLLPVGNKNLSDINKTRNGTSPNESQIANLIDSVEETFFGPAEIPRQITAKQGTSLASSSKNVQPKINSEKEKSSDDRSKIAEADDPLHSVPKLKRKSINETIANAEKELEGLSIDWDAELSDENWVLSEPQPNNSFDIPPEKAKKSPKYAHEDKVDKSKEKRSKLRGWDCWQCEKYYATMDLPEAEIKKRMNACSRHRAKFNPRYFTPKGFWDPEFPDATDSSDCDSNDSMIIKNK